MAVILLLGFIPPQCPICNTAFIHWNSIFELKLDFPILGALHPCSLLFMCLVLPIYTLSYQRSHIMVTCIYVPPLSVIWPSPVYIEVNNVLCDWLIFQQGYYLLSKCDLLSLLYVTIQWVTRGRKRTLLSGLMVAGAL